MTGNAGTDRLGALCAQGVSIWLDDLSRQRMDSGSLARLVEDRHVVGVTTNPSIFAQALGEGDAYEAQLGELARAGADAESAVRLITTDDVRRACDLLRGVHDTTTGVDGRVSLEVDPRLAHDTAATIAAAKDLWSLVDRPNLYIKIPATPAGIPAITAVLAEGISVNVTLIFSLDRYRAVLDAFLDGLERARRDGRPLASLGSVASFFVSRVDTEIDARLEKVGSQAALGLRGTAAIANARLAYETYEHSLAGERWTELAAGGARPQRPLWASTGVKDPAYEDTRYVVDLVAPDTVNTMPEATLDAMADHGEIRGDTARGCYAAARRVLEDLAAVGVDYDEVVAVLEREGVEKFQASWDQLLDTVRSGLERLGGEPDTAR